MRIRLSMAAFWALFFICFSLALSQEWKPLLESIYSLGSPPGYERPLLDHVPSFLPSSWPKERDSLGSLFIPAKNPSAGCLVAAPVDELGFFVSGITPDGYLRLDRAVNPPHRLFESFLVGHGVVIWTKKGPLPGIVAQPAVHILSREKREQLERGATLEDIYIDVGAKSEAEVKAKGIEKLDAVTRERSLTFLGSRRLSGYCLGDKIFAALLVVAIRSSSQFSSRFSDDITIAWVAQARVGARGAKGSQSLGLLNLKNRLQPKKAIILSGWPEQEDNSKPGPRLGQGPVLIFAEEKPPALAASIIEVASAEKIPLQVLAKQESPLLRPFQVEGNESLIFGLTIRDVASPAETISLADADSWLKLLKLWLEKGGEK